MTKTSVAELDARLRIAERVVGIFRLERFTYVAVTLVAFVLLVASGALMLSQNGAHPAELTLLFGSTGLLTVAGSQILTMWRQTLKWIDATTQGSEQ